MKIYNLCILLILSFLGSFCTTQREENVNSVKKLNTENAQTISNEQFFEAALEGDFATVEKAIVLGIDVNLVNSEKNSALMLAAFNGYTQVVSYLLKNGANVNQRGSMDRTALMFAASGEFPETVSLLIDEGADINLVDNGEHFTALMFAAAEGNMLVVKVLLKAGADKTLKDVDNETAFDFAMKNGHSAVAELLK